MEIHASVKKELVNKFDPLLSEGSSKILINFRLGQSVGFNRTNDHPYKIYFLETTRVIDAVDTKVDPNVSIFILALKFFITTYLSNHFLNNLISLIGFHVCNVGVFPSR